MKKRKLNQVQYQAKILLTQAIIKNWDQATEQEKKGIEKWWKETYGEIILFFVVWFFVLFQ